MLYLADMFSTPHGGYQRLCLLGQARFILFQSFVRVWVGWGYGRWVCVSVKLWGKNWYNIKVAVGSTRASCTVFILSKLYSVRHNLIICLPQAESASSHHGYLTISVSHKSNGKSCAFDFIFDLAGKVLSCTLTGSTNICSHAYRRKYLLN